MQIIPTDGSASPWFDQTTTLDGVPYVLDFRHSRAEDRWYLSIGLPDGTEVRKGIKVVSSYPLLWRETDSRLPNGELFCVPASADDSPPGLADLLPGGRCYLVYVPKAELLPSFESWRL